MFRINYLCQILPVVWICLLKAVTESAPLNISTSWPILSNDTTTINIGKTSAIEAAYESDEFSAEIADLPAFQKTESNILITKGKNIKKSFVEEQNKQFEEIEKSTIAKNTNESAIVEETTKKNAATETTTMASKTTSDIFQRFVEEYKLKPQARMSIKDTKITTKSVFENLIIIAEKLITVIAAAEYTKEPENSIYRMISENLKAAQISEEIKNGIDKKPEVNRTATATQFAENLNSKLILDKAKLTTSIENTEKNNSINTTDDSEPETSTYLSLVAEKLEQETASRNIPEVAQTFINWVIPDEKRTVTAEQTNVVAESKLVKTNTKSNITAMEAVATTTTNVDESIKLTVIIPMDDSITSDEHNSIISSLFDITSDIPIADAIIDLIDEPTQTTREVADDVALNGELAAILSNDELFEEKKIIESNNDEKNELMNWFLSDFESTSISNELSSEFVITSDEDEAEAFIPAVAPRFGDEEHSILLETVAYCGGDKILIGRWCRNRA